jgi:2-desacetyl-2-hydroxyethyl bacteriochlorophyllide A dehydrogenase
MAVRATEVQPGEVVAVIGGGPVGSLAATCARVAGAAHVVVADPAPERRRNADARGVAPEDLGKTVADLTGGRGAPVVIEAVGTASALDLAVRTAAPQGRVAVAGVHHADAAFPAGIAFGRELTVRFVVGDPIAVREPVLALVSAGRIDPAVMVSHSLPLAAAADAYDLYDRRVARKVALVP